MFTFIIRRDSEGRDVGRFSLANTILKNSLAVAFNFSFVCTVCFCMLGVFFTAGSPAGTKVSVTWESKYDVGRPETCKDPKNITDEAILCTFLSA